MTFFFSENWPQSGSDDRNFYRQHLRNVYLPRPNIRDFGRNFRILTWKSVADRNFYGPKFSKIFKKSKSMASQHHFAPSTNFIAPKIEDLVCEEDHGKSKFSSWFWDFEISNFEVRIFDYPSFSSGTRSSSFGVMKLVAKQRWDAIVFDF